jgi:hypothetical protein
MWSEANTRKSLKERLTGKEDGKVVRSLSEDEDYLDMEVWPKPDRLSRKDRKNADRILREGKQPKKKR